MIALIVSGLSSAFLMIIFGLVTAKILRISADFFETIFLGLAISNAVATLISVFSPVNSYILALLLAFSLLMVFYVKPEAAHLLSSVKKRKQILILALPFIIVALIRSLCPPINYDTGLYHIQAIKWIEQYHVVPGLANLHSRFGLNSNIFTFFALTSVNSLFGQEIFSVNLIVFSVLILFFISRIFSAYFDEGISGRLIFYILVFCIFFTLNANLNSPSPDMISVTLPLFILMKMTEKWLMNEDDDSRKDIVLVILCVYVISVKLAALPVIIPAVFLIFRKNYKTERIVAIAAVSALIIVPWVARYVILTGWLIYPFTSLDIFSFDWKVPFTIALNEKYSVTGFARSPGPGWSDAARMNIIQWFPAWWHGTAIKYKLLISISVISPVTCLMTGLIAGKVKSNISVSVAIFTSLCGVIFWLFMAPDIRFGEGFIIFAAFSPFLLTGFRTDFLLKYARYPLFLVMLFFIFMTFVKKSTGFGIRHIASDCYNYRIKPGLEEIPAGEIIKKVHINGIDIYTPVISDKCYDHELPCTPYPDKNLVMRGSGFAAGFRLLTPAEKNTEK